MQLTLVSNHGKKPSAFAQLCRELQQQLTIHFGEHFEPYELAQIHGTIVGLEGELTPAGILNANFLRYRDCERWVDLRRLIAELRRLEPFTIRVGNFAEREDFGFTSNGAHPFIRSFSIQSEIAVAVGWPWKDGRPTSVLGDLRKSFERSGVLHKWHRHEQDRDNDFFFVLGRVNRSVLDERMVKHAEQALRTFLAESTSVAIPVSTDSLAFVAYQDPRLPLETSVAWPVMDAQLTPEKLIAAYD